MKTATLISFLFSFSILFSQEKLSKSFRFKTDNDLYTSVGKDRYYTSGIFLTYYYLSKKKTNKVEKTVYELEIGHQMYTPYKANLVSVSLHDRPFAGYLYGGFGLQRVYKNHQILKTSLQLGILGPAAFGKELQDFMHRLFDYSGAVGWKHQIKNALGINLNITHNKYILKNTSNYLDLTWMNTAKLGTIFTNISSGFFGRIGLIPLQKLENSIAFDTALNNKNTLYKREKEAFFYLKTTAHYSLYNATLQGSFLNKGSEVTSNLIPFHLAVELGVKTTYKRLNFSYAYYYNSQKSKGLRYTNGNYYGSIQLSYLFI